MDTNGVEIIIPIIPKKWENIISPIIIRIGFSFKDFDIIYGCNKTLSKICKTTIIIRVIIPNLNDIDNPTITAGIPPIYGPK